MNQINGYKNNVINIHPKDSPNLVAELDVFAQCIRIIAQLLIDLLRLLPLATDYAVLEHEHIQLVARLFGFEPRLANHRPICGVCGMEILHLPQRGVNTNADRT